MSRGTLLQPLIAFISEVHQGVKGTVTDGITGQTVANVSLKISGRDIPFGLSKRGEFWRILLPGDYQLEVN